jgi:hypothetical protein
MRSFASSYCLLCTLVVQDEVMVNVIHVLARGPRDRANLVQAIGSRPPSFAFSVPLAPTYNSHS